MITIEYGSNQYTRRNASIPGVRVDTKGNTLTDAVATELDYVVSQVAQRARQPISKLTVTKSDAAGIGLALAISSIAFPPMLIAAWVIPNFLNVMREEGS